MRRSDTTRDLLALADGTLTDRRRARALALVAADEGARRLVEQQQQIRAALTGLAVTPPDRLHRNVARMRVSRMPPRPVPRLRLAALAACASVALAVALDVVPSSDDPTSAAIVAAVHRVGGASRPVSFEAGRLRHSFAGVTFPDWAVANEWRAVGARRDTVAGRRTDTVFYAHDGHRIAYTVVAGAPIGAPGEARRLRVRGTDVALYHEGSSRTVVMFERGGRTCVLTGDVQHDDTLVRLAAWG